MRTRLTLVALLAVVPLAACSTGSGRPSAAPTLTPVSPSPTTPITPSALVQSSSGGEKRVRLTGDGIDLPDEVLVFGTPVEQGVVALRAGLGEPTRDTGVGSSFGDYGTCPGTKLRALEYGGGALVVLFGDVKGAALTMYQWALHSEGTPARVPQASAFVGDVTTFEFGVGTTVAALRAGVGQELLTVAPADEPVAAQFEVKDQSSGISGFLSGTTGRDKTTFVMAGQACGE